MRLRWPCPLFIGLIGISCSVSAQAPASPDDPILAGLAPEVRKDYVVTPAGLFHRSCVLQVENGETVEEGGVRRKDGSFKPIEPCKYPSFRLRHDNRIETIEPQSP